MSSRRNSHFGLSPRRGFSSLSRHNTHIATLRKTEPGTPGRPIKARSSMRIITSGTEKTLQRHGANRPYYEPVYFEPAC
jgi:hypothetical protein